MKEKKAMYAASCLRATGQLLFGDEDAALFQAADKVGSNPGTHQNMLRVI